MVEATPPWSVVRCACSTTFLIKSLFSGRKIGYCPAILPLHSRTPVSLSCRFSSTFTPSTSPLLFASCCTLWIHQIVLCSVSFVFNGPYSRSALGLRQLRMKRCIHAPILSTFRSRYDSSNSSNSSRCGLAVDNA